MLIFKDKYVTRSLAMMSDDIIAFRILPHKTKDGFAIISRLPGTKSFAGEAMTMDEAKLKVRQLFDEWLRRCCLEEL